MLCHRVAVLLTLTELLLRIGGQVAGSSGSAQLDSVVQMDSVAQLDSAVQMLTVSHVLFVRPGDAVRLDCQFETSSFNLFDNPVLWKKSQQYEETQLNAQALVKVIEYVRTETQVNMMGNLLEPFVSARRFRVEFEPQPPSYTLLLNIADISVEDNGNYTCQRRTVGNYNNGCYGNYTCQVHGPQNSLLANVTHTIVVEGRIDDIILTNKNTPTLDELLELPPVTSPLTSSTITTTTLTAASPLPDMTSWSNESTSVSRSPEPHIIVVSAESSNSAEMTSSFTATTKSTSVSEFDHSRQQQQQRRSIVYSEGSTYPLRCLAVSHSTPLDLVIHIGRHNITGDFRFVRSVSASGRVGMRRLRYVAELSRNDFRPGADDNGKKVTCTVLSLGVAANSTNVRLIVHHAPLIECESSEAYIDDFSVFLRCEIRARPPLKSLYWVIDANGTMVMEGEPVGDYWSIDMQHTNGVIETQLYVRRATVESFRNYELVAQNSVATRRQTAQLTQKFRPSSLPIITAAGRKLPHHLPPMKSASAADLSGAIGPLVYFSSSASTADPAWRRRCILACLTEVALVSAGLSLALSHR